MSCFLNYTFNDRSNRYVRGLEFRFFSCEHKEYGRLKLRLDVILQELEVAGIPLDKVRIYSSPFRRTQETAETVITALNTVKPSTTQVSTLLHILQASVMNSVCLHYLIDFYFSLWACNFLKDCESVTLDLLWSFRATCM